MLLLVAFFIVHMLMILAAGPINELRSIITGWYRTDPPAGDKPPGGLTMPTFRINRRRFLTAATLGASGLALSGCDAFDPLSDTDSSVRNVLERANDLTYRVQRLLAGRDALAQEYHRGRHPPAAAPQRRDRAGRRHLQGPARQQFRRLAAGGHRPGREAAVAVARSADGHAGAHPDHPARLRRGLELHRQMDRRAAGAGAGRGQGEAAGTLCRVLLPRHDRQRRWTGRSNITARST